MNKFVKDRSNERGGAGVKMLVVGTILVLAAYAAFSYIPTAYDGQSLKQEMDTAVVQGMAVMPGVSPTDNVKNRILKAAVNNNVPPNPFVEVKMVNGILQARVYYVKELSLLPFGLWKHQYQFDYTAVPAGFLLKQ